MLPVTSLDRRLVRDIRRAVLQWYSAERRDLPWRHTRDPYAVLVSEVMLQQTQAARVVPRFERFMARFPTAQALAESSSAEVLAEWSGLGYNRRALALQRAAAEVAAHGWPADVAGLQRLPGVGAYTARAIASIAFGVPVGVLDTNVRRWLVRRFGGPADPRRLQALADELAAPGRGSEVADWTQATMELGASACRARVALCARCPIATGCGSRGQPSHVPVPRQPALGGSDRQLRGAVARALAAAPGHRALEARLRATVARLAGPTQGRWQRVVDALERDGIAHRRGRELVLGTATIDR